jgi:cytoskeletal protein RodZ
MRERLQGGSLAGFLIIGGLLALVLVGGLYGLNRYNAQKAAEEVAANEAAEEQSPDWESSPEPESQEGRTNTDATPEEAENGAATDERTPAEEESATEIPTTGQPEELPQTGPADTALGLLILGLLTFAATHYVRSRA